MDAHLTLLAGLQTRAARSEGAELSEEDVRAIAVALGLADAEANEALDALVDQGALQFRRNGEIRVLEAKSTGRSDDRGAGPTFAGPIYGNLIYSTGEQGKIDSRGSGYGAAYKPQAGPQLEAVFGVLAEAVVELRSRLPELDGEAATQAQALEASARQVTEQARADPASPTLRERVQILTAQVEDVARLQNAAAKLGPTLTVIRDAASALWQNLPL